MYFDHFVVKPFELQVCMKDTLQIKFIISSYCQAGEGFREHVAHGYVTKGVWNENVSECS